MSFDGIGETAVSPGEIVLALKRQYYPRYGWQMVTQQDDILFILAGNSMAPPEDVRCRFRLTAMVGNKAFIEFIGLRKATGDEVARAREGVL